MGEYEAKESKAGHDEAWLGIAAELGTEHQIIAPS
jgi:hypothetical protein